MVGSTTCSVPRVLSINSIASIQNFPPAVLATPPLADLGNRRNAAGSAESAVSVLRQSPPAIPSQPSSATANATAATIDQVIDQLGRHGLLAEKRSGPNEETVADRSSSSGLSEARSQLSACLVITTVGAGCLHLARRRRRRASGRKIEAQGRQMT